MTREWKFCLIAAVAALSVTMVSVAQAVLIDDFNTGGGSVSATGGGNDTDTSAAANAVGGSRTLDIPDPSGSPVVGPNNLDIQANPGNLGVLTFSLGALTSGSGKLTWDANGAGLGGIDLTDGGASNSFQLDIQSIDQGNVDLTFMVEDQSNVTSSFTASNLGAGVVNIPFASLVGGSDLTDIDQIMLGIEGQNASDLVLDFLETAGPGQVPEPASILIWSLMALGAAGYFVRRRVNRA